MTTSIQRINPGKRLSDATVHNGVAYLAGQVPDDASKPIGEQTRSVLAQIDAILARVGSDKTRILTATIYLAEIRDFAAMNEVWDAWVGADNQTPARATVQARLASPHDKVEIQVIAALA
ncbi:MAG TPA: RidA family protein [Burkholderiaceae bacterium]|nr:RidA family protein [Burkholderiaceae bacterium]